MDERFGGVASKAAESAGLEQPHFARLLKASYKTITLPTATKLRRFLPEERRPLFDKLVLGAATLALMRTAYKDWLKEASSRQFFTDVAFFHRERGYLTFVPASDEVISFVAHQSQIVGEALTRFPSYVAPLDNAIKAGKHTLVRKSVSWARIVEPLLDHYKSALVERGWHELSDAEKRRFLDASVKREVILLKREPNHLRAAAAVFVALAEPHEAKASTGNEGARKKG